MATYCLRNDGTALTRASATGPISDPSKCMNVSVHNAEAFSSGDVIVIGNQGGIVVGMVVPPSSGVEYIADSDDVATIGGAVFPTFTKSGDVWSASVEDTVYDVFVYSGGLSAEYALTRNSTTPTTPALGEWGQAGGALYVRLADDATPNGATYAVTSPQVWNVVTLTDVVIDGYIIPFSARHEWHGHLGGIVLNTGCDGCQTKNITGNFSQHALTIYSGAVDCVADGFSCSDCWSSGVAVAQGTLVGDNVRSILRDSYFTRCGLEAGGAHTAVFHGAGTSNKVIDALVENCTLVHGDGTGYGHGISSWHSSGLVVKKCSVSGYNESGKDALNLQATATGAKALNNVIKDSYNGLQFTGDTLVFGNYIQGAVYCCVRANSPTGKIVCNTLDANNKPAGYPLAIWTGNNVVVANNNFVRGRYPVRDMTANSVVAVYNGNNEYGFTTAKNIATITEQSANISVDPLTFGENGELAALSPCIGAGVHVTGVTDTISDRDGTLRSENVSIGADQTTGIGFGTWTPFDATLPTLSLSPTAPGDLRSVQAWSKVASAKEINKVTKDITRQ